MSFFSLRTSLWRFWLWIVYPISWSVGIAEGWGIVIRHHRRIIQIGSEAAHSPSSTSAKTHTSTKTHAPTKSSSISHASSESSSKTTSEAKARTWIHKSRAWISSAITSASSCHRACTPGSCSVSSWHLLHLLSLTELFI